MIVGQILGIIATIITCISYQANTKKSLLLLQSVATSFTCLSFLFLGASTGFVLNIVCLIRNIPFYFMKEGTVIHRITAGGFALLILGLGIMSWQGWYSLFIIIALSANTLIISLGKPQLLRKSILVTSSMVLTYNIFVFSMGGIANEAVSILSSIVGIIRYRKPKKTKEEKEI